MRVKPTMSAANRRNSNNLVTIHKWKSILFPDYLRCMRSGSHIGLGLTLMFPWKVGTLFIPQTSSDVDRCVKQSMSPNNISTSSCDVTAMLHHPGGFFNSHGSPIPPMDMTNSHGSRYLPVVPSRAFHGWKSTSQILFQMDRSSIYEISTIQLRCY